MPKFFCNIADPNYPYPYCIDFPAAIAFAVLFGLTTIIHFTQAIYFRKKFCWVIVMAGLWETTSYILRALSAYDISPLGFGVPSQVLVQLAPLWINAFVYMIFGRLVYYFLPDKRVAHLSARRLSLIFVLLDVGSFLVQGAGASLAQPGQDSPKLTLTGLRVYQGGVGAQQFFILVFIGLATRCQVKLKSVDALQYRETSWRKALYPVYGALFLITIRIIYRLTEFAGGFDSGFSKKEAPFYVLEATPMTICMFLFNVYHPGAVLVGDDSEFPKKKKKEKRKSKKSKSNDDIPDQQVIELNEVQDSNHDIERSPSYKGSTSWDQNHRIGGGPLAITSPALDSVHV